MKLIVTNRRELTRKYTPSGWMRIDAALQALITADALRGINTAVSFVDDPALGAASVSTPSDPAQNKRAIDKLCTSHEPDYLMVLGSIDVIPHQDIINPCFGGSDPDQFAWSDLPYACPGPYSQQTADFLNPIRVVGRLPDLTGATVPDYLLKLLTNATAVHPPTTRDVYTGYLGVSAQVWNNSTALSLTNTFGNATAMKMSPPDGPAYTPAEMQPRSHFFNCHGAPVDPQFYGQSGSNFPVAHQASYLPGRITNGTVASCECCYGAELYDPNAPGAGGQMAIANAYLKEGAFAFFGSTTIAYGPATGNGAADLICQYFLQSILSGASAGRAALEARQKFITVANPMTPVDSKTISQFILLADPSVQPVEAPAPQEEFYTKAAGGLIFEAAPKARARSRNIRRAMLADRGWALANSASVVTEEKGGALPPEIHSEIMKRIAEEKAGKPQFKSFRVQLPKSERFRKSVAKESLTQAVHLATARLETEHPKMIRVVAYVALENEAGFALQTVYSR